MKNLLNEFISGLTPAKDIGFIVFLSGVVLYIIWMEAMASDDWNWKKTVAIGCIIIGILPIVYSSLNRADAIRCSQCDQTVTTQFCPDCGWQVNSQTTTCPTCKVPCNTTYCPSCGTKIPHE